MSFKDVFTSVVLSYGKDWRLMACFSGVTGQPRVTITWSGSGTLGNCHNCVSSCCRCVFMWAFRLFTFKNTLWKEIYVNQTATTVIHNCMKMFLFLTQNAAYFPHSVQGKTIAESVSPLVVLLEGELLTEAEPKGWVSVVTLCSFGELQSSRRLFWFHVSPFVSLEKNGISLPRNKCLLVPTPFFLTSTVINCKMGGGGEHATHAP